MLLMILWCFSLWSVECKVWNQVRNLRLMGMAMVGGLNWFVHWITHAGECCCSALNPFFHFQDPKHTIHFWSCQMAAAFAKMHIGNIMDMQNGFCSWHFQQKTRTLHAEALHCVQTDWVMLDHCAPFSIAPVPSMVVMPLEVPCGCSDASNFLHKS